ncbi:DUF11 domain-containing protein [Streptomyces sp. NPDC093982]|uniref:DUF11 domain-containing protein n=1 Tax=Streptomyces sp. NPDC093982 TaxID=3155077 RepID=UPI00342508E4
MAATVIAVGAVATAVPTVFAETASAQDGPTVSCSTDANIFNTAYDAATDGTLPGGSLDTNWEVTSQQNTNPAPPVSGDSGANPTLDALPPAGTPFKPAIVASSVPATYAKSPYGNADWISETADTLQGDHTGTWYYRYDFNLAPTVDPASFALKMSFLADNAVQNIWVNGASQKPYNPTSLPQTNNPAVTSSPPGNTYWANGFTSAASLASVMLNHNWQAGANSIIVQVDSGPGAQAFLAQAVASAVCPTDLSVHKDGPGRVDPGGEVTYHISVTNNGPSPSSGWSITDPLPAGLQNPSTSNPGCTISGGTLTCSGGPLAVGATATVTVTGTAPTNSPLTLNNTVTVTPKDPDLIESNNTSTVMTDVLPIPMINPAIGSAAAAAALGAGGILYLRRRSTLGAGI